MLISRSLMLGPLRPLVRDLEAVEPDDRAAVHLDDGELVRPARILALRRDRRIRRKRTDAHFGRGQLLDADVAEPHHHRLELDALLLRALLVHLQADETGLRHVVVDVRDRIPVDPGPDPRALAADANLVPAALPERFLRHIGPGLRRVDVKPDEPVAVAAALLIVDAARAAAAGGDFRLVAEHLVQPLLEGIPIPLRIVLLARLGAELHTRVAAFAAELDLEVEVAVRLFRRQERVDAKRTRHPLALDAAVLDGELRVTPDDLPAV